MLPVSQTEKEGQLPRTVLSEGSTIVRDSTLLVSLFLRMTVEEEILLRIMDEGLI